MINIISPLINGGLDNAYQYYIYNLFIHAWEDYHAILLKKNNNVKITKIYPFYYWRKKLIFLSKVENGSMALDITHFQAHTCINI